MSPVFEPNADGFYSTRPAGHPNPYGTSATEDPRLSPHGLYLRPEFSELRDYSAESIRRVREAHGEEPLGVRVGADVAERLDSTALPVDRGGDPARLRLGVLDVSHEDFLSSRDAEAVTSASIEPTVEGTADTLTARSSRVAAELGGAAGEAADASPAATPHDVADAVNRIHRLGLLS